MEQLEKFINIHGCLKFQAGQLKQKLNYIFLNLSLPDVYLFKVNIKDLNFNKDFPTGTKFDFITIHFIALKQSYDDCKFAAEFLSKDFYDIEM